jgi:hypothetical protein
MSFALRFANWNYRTQVTNQLSHFGILVGVDKPQFFEIVGSLLQGFPQRCCQDGDVAAHGNENVPKDAIFLDQCSILCIVYFLSASLVPPTG